MTGFDLRPRSYNFSLELVKFINRIGVARPISAIFNQLLRAGTSVGANIEEADSSPTRKDFKYKMTIAKKEAAEAVYWFKIIIDAAIIKNEGNVAKAKELLDECSQILKILGAIIRKIK